MEFQDISKSKVFYWLKECSESSINRLIFGKKSSSFVISLNTLSNGDFVNWCFLRILTEKYFINNEKYMEMAILLMLSIWIFFFFWYCENLNFLNFLNINIKTNYQEVFQSIKYILLLFEKQKKTIRNESMKNHKN